MMLTARRCMSTITRMRTTDPRMSSIVIHNGLVHMAGQTDGTNEDVAAQTKVCLEKIDDILAEAGSSKSSLISASIWLKHIEKDFKTFNSVWNEWVDPENKPVRFCVEANLARPVLLVEVQVTAAVESS